MSKWVSKVRLSYIVVVESSTISTWSGWSITHVLLTCIAGVPQVCVAFDVKGW